MAKVSMINNNNKRIALVNKFKESRDGLRSAIKVLGYMIRTNYSDKESIITRLKGIGPVVHAFIARKGKADQILPLMEKESPTEQEICQVQMICQEYLHLMPLNSSKTRIRNRCMLTGRPRGVYRDFGLCRHEIRRLALLCQLPGIRQSSW